MAADTATSRMDDLQWPRTLNKVVTKQWSELKNTLVMKDFVDHLIQKRVVTLDYWMGLKSKSISESERTEDFLALVMKFNQQKYFHFLEALNKIDRHDLVKSLSKALDMKEQKTKEIYDAKKVNKQAEKDKGRHSEKTKGNTSIKQKSRETSKVNSLKSNRAKADDKVKGLKGQTDADQMPTDISNYVDGQDLSVKAEMGTVHNKKSTTPINKKQNGPYQSIITQNLYKGIVNGEKVEHNPDENKPESQVEKVTPKQNKAIEPDKLTDKTNLEGKDQTLRPGTSKSREEILEEREKILQSKESELKKKEMELKEQEKSLIEKETKILTRENSMLTFKTSETDEGLQSLPIDFEHLQLDSNRTTASTTSSSELLAEVREQLKEMKRIKEIESENTMYCNTPKDEYVKLQDFQNVQHHIDNLSEEINTERESRQIVQQKVEDLKQEIENLHATIKHFEEDKESKDIEFEREINRLKTELKNAKLNYNEGLNRLKMDSKSKESEIVSLKRNVDTMKGTAEDLEKRIKMLENDKLRYEHELQRYEKEVSELKIVLEEKENELSDLRSVLAETETEKEELIDELAELKNEITKLKGDKKKLENEKKTLLGRCVKPQWNQSQSGSFRKTSFK